MILCDTNILIEFYKGNPEIVGTLQQIGPSNLAISAVTTGELYYGAKDKRELHKIQKHLSLLQQIPLDEEISAHFISLLATYSLSHKLSIPDALIAATAISQEISIYTLNVKDFHFISKVQLYTR
jgi:tRNA(fMet)-specific endonuclease VapC